ncbi:MAG TPA: S41 family peptidase, partial [Fimbriimonadaceae bacterium]|nr:S41 family peptidase [Fimbriimonadaceae bacterium]
KISEVMPRSEADKDESQLKVGETILKVNGKPVRPGNDFDRALNDKVGRTVTLEVIGTDGKPRTMKIQPQSWGAARALIYERWYDERKEIVEKASGGRLGYLHVSGMGDSQRNRFERELFSTGIQKEGMVLDFRGNNGGDTHDSLLKILSRTKHYFTFAPRTEAPYPQPERAYTKPTIVLMDEFSLSDAEVFANGYRELGLGKIVGNTTMGWIIFTSGRGLIDGSFIRTPHLGCFTNDGRDMENWGVPPDIKVVYTPADFVAGKDTILLRGVEELLKDGRLRK